MNSAMLLLLMLLAGCVTPIAPPPSPEATRADRQCGKEPALYRVKSGDSLFKIGWIYCLDYLDIARWNRLRNPDLIVVGQSLRLRPKNATAQRSTSRTPPSVAVTDRPDTVTRTPPSSPPPPSPPPARSVQPVAAVSGSSNGWQWPMRGRVVSQFRPNQPGYKGIKISSPPGRTVRAARRGQIVYAGSSLPGYGTLIIVEHSDGLLSAYGHLGTTYVKEGDSVERGQVIAELSGGADQQPTLHFEVRKDGEPVNPLNYLPS